MRRLRGQTLGLVGYGQLARAVVPKALALGLKPIVVVNKVDKPGANPDKVINAAFDLFDKLGATDEQLDFPVVYASGINGWSSLEEGPAGEQWGPDMSALFDTVLKHVPVQKGDPNAAMDLANSAVRNAPNSVEARLALIRTMLAKRDFARADEALKPVEKVFPNVVTVVVLRATTDLFLNRLPAARAGFDRAAFRPVA